MAKGQGLSQSAQALIQRHAAVEGTVTGANALAEFGNISNADPDEAIFQKGDKFTVPALEDLAAASFIARLGTAKVPAIVVDMDGGGSKVLYLSSTRKRVIEFEETAEGFTSKRNAAGAVISHCAGDYPAGKAFYEKMKNLPTAKAMAEEMAGKHFEIVDVAGPFQTSRVGVIKDEYGNESRGVVGLRNTNINVIKEG